MAETNKASWLDLEELKQRIPADRAVHYVGFTPSRSALAGWRRSTSEDLSGEYAAPVRRTIWDPAEKPAADDGTATVARMILDVTECASASEAMDALAERLYWNELAELPAGPADLGEVSFVHPEGLPPAAFFVRGNLLISAISFGNAPAPATDVALALDQGLIQRPDESRQVLSFESDRASAKAGGRATVRFAVPWTLGEEGYLALFLEGGTLERGDDRYLLTLAAPGGDVVLEVFAIEPGRETYGGRLVLPAE